MPDPVEPGTVQTDPKPPGPFRKLLIGLLAIAVLVLLVLGAIRALEHLKS